jgi:hypothetical protein
MEGLVFVSQRFSAHSIKIAKISSSPLSHSLELPGPSYLSAPFSLKASPL